MFHTALTWPDVAWAAVNGAFILGLIWSWEHFSKSKKKDKDTK